MSKLKTNISLTNKHSWIYNAYAFLRCRADIIIDGRKEYECEEQQQPEQTSWFLVHFLINGNEYCISHT